MQSPTPTEPAKEPCVATCVEPKDISFFDSQNSEYLPASQHIKDLGTPRHKVGAWRCVVNCIKAPLVPASVALRAAHQLSKGDHRTQTPPTLLELKCAPPGSDSAIPITLYYKLICWFHKAQCRHARRAKLIDSPESQESFLDYLDRTFDYDHFNIFLLVIPLHKRNTAYTLLVGIYTLYIKIGQMIAREKVPSVSYEHLTGYHGPRGLYDPDSWVGEKKASSVVSARDLATVPKDTVIKLMEMLSSIVSGIPPSDGAGSIDPPPDSMGPPRQELLPLFQDKDGTARRQRDLIATPVHKENGASDPLTPLLPASDKGIDFPATPPNSRRTFGDPRHGGDCPSRPICVFLHATRERGTPYEHMTLEEFLRLAHIPQYDELTQAHLIACLLCNTAAEINPNFKISEYHHICLTALNFRKRNGFHGPKMEAFLHACHIRPEDKVTRAQLKIHGISHWTFLVSSSEAELLHLGFPLGTSHLLCAGVANYPLKAHVTQKTNIK
ncbi:hypothetical protein PCANC_15567 [Puccinia coronata f. sp. avenae]|uniref:Uncharacterized protein n=1 Tax=Puccinia coronata f. sp. avenae TaxID=200324 RepID=A0A2N5SX79_9BASI|nr:hypothetical protein PCANC_15567 [Puccinia coronata f. sp. avenae]